MKISHTLSLLTLSAALAACGGSSTPSTDDILSGEDVTLDEFTLTGTSAADSSGVVPINSGVNNGSFSMSWKVSTADQIGYYIGAYLSDDTTLETGVTGDPRILNKTCMRINGCTSSESTSCRFTNSNTIECELGTAYPQSVNISSFLDTLPKTTNLIVQVCNSLFNKCKTEMVTVQLQ